MRLPNKALSVLVLALVAWIALDFPIPDGSPADPRIHEAVGQREGPIVREVVVRDLDGRVAWRGDMDLGPAIARIERGEADPHRNDGGVFGNRERRLPDKPRGYYREFVVRTPGMRDVGPQRLVVGRGGEAWYTHDHYRTFVRLDVAVQPP